MTGWMHNYIHLSIGIRLRQGGRILFSKNFDSANNSWVNQTPSPPYPPLPEGEGGETGRPGGTRCACAARTPRPTPPPLQGAGAGEWGDSDARFANLLGGSLHHPKTFSR